MVDELDRQIKAVEAKIDKIEVDIEKITEQLVRTVAQLEWSGHKLSREKRAELVADKKRLSTEREQLHLREEKMLIEKAQPPGAQIIVVFIG